MLNPNLDIVPHITVFKEKGFTVLSNILEEHYAEFIQAELNAIPYKDWTSIVGTYGHYVDFRGDPQSNEAQEKKLQALKQYEQGGLAHSYQRHDIVSDLKYTSYVLSSNFKQVIQTLTGEVCLSIGKNGAFKHVHNDFISRHRYIIPESIGYILNVSKDWEADYGGLLHFEDIYTKEVVILDIGKFNTLVLFDIDRTQHLQRSFSRVNIIHEARNRVYLEGTFRKMA